MKKGDGGDFFFGVFTMFLFRKRDQGLRYRYNYLKIVVVGG